MYESLLKYFCVVFGCFLFVSTITAQLQIQPRIIGGKEAEKNYPFMISLLHDSRYGRQHICGGSIINARTILTAAHCLSYLTSDTLKVHVGDKSLELKHGKIFDVEKIYSHERYNSSGFDYDVGLIRIADNLEFSYNIKPIRLAGRTERVPANSYATVVGWGYTDLNNQTLSPHLQEASVPIVKQSICNSQMNGAITSRMLCAGFKNGGIDSCKYDSGGPLVANNKQIGIVSWGNGCALPNKPGIYARVSVLLPWIQNVLYTNYNEILF